MICDLVLGHYFSNINLRILTKALMERIDEKRVQLIRKHGEMWPGGDVRIGANQWLRAVYHGSTLKKVPRENSLRQSLTAIVKKKNLRTVLSINWYSCSP